MRHSRLSGQGRDAQQNRSESFQQKPRICVFAKLPALSALCPGNRAVGEAPTYARGLLRFLPSRQPRRPCRVALPVGSAELTCGGFPFPGEDGLTLDLITSRISDTTSERRCLSFLTSLLSFSPPAPPHSVSRGLSVGDSPERPRFPGSLSLAP